MRSTRNDLDRLCRLAWFAAAQNFAAAALLSGLICAGGPASAQNVPPGLLAPGNAVVTGFSGAIPPAQIAPGVDPGAKTFIDLNAPSARIVDLQSMHGPMRAQLVDAIKPYNTIAAQTGQVFAVALDNAVPPNVYIAATSAYGLPIVAPGPDGQTLHVRLGAPDASFMLGLWGPLAQGGGPGSIWKVDGVTGAVGLFANVTLDGVANSGPGLGGLAFDPDSNSLFVADRDTGMIHRFDINGGDRGRYDHGVQGLGAAGLPPVPFNPAKRLNVASPQFNSEDPATWAYAPPERLIYGLGVRAGRLYYAVAAGSQIWSVGLGPDRSFGNDATMEINVPPSAGPTEISKITFDEQGRMFLAERPAPTGAYDFHALTWEGIGRVLRYAILESYPGLPRVWQPVPDEYAIGFPRDLRNGNGGVAIGFDYDRLGLIDPGTCGGFIWSTGEQLRKSADRALAARLAQSGQLNINGLQGNFIWTIRPDNTPPLKSYFIDSDDRFYDDAASGHMGDIAIWRICGPVLRGGWMLPSWFVWWEGGGQFPPPPNLTCPPDQQKPGFLCCPKGSAPDTIGQCKPSCPNGAMDSKSQNICGLGFDNATYDPNSPGKVKCIGGGAPAPGKGILGCVDKSPVLNPPVCQVGWSKQNLPNVGNVCMPTTQQLQCPKGQQVSSIDNKCHALCFGGAAWPAKQCCAPGAMVTGTGQCCPVGSTFDPKTGQCSKIISVCPKGSKPDPKTGVCAPPNKACPPGSTPNPKTGACDTLTSSCPPGLSLDPVTEECKPPPKQTCAPSQQSSDGTCCQAGWAPNNVSGGCCPPGQTPAAVTGICKPTSCTSPNEQIGGKCCSPADLKPGGACATLICGPGKTSAGANNFCCDNSRVYTGRTGTSACCAGSVVNGQCQPSLGGTPVLPSCSPGSTDPNCCATGYKAMGSACCLASQLTSSGVCCPVGQQPGGADKSQCQPIKIHWDPPGGRLPPYRVPNDGGSGGQCCLAGLIPAGDGSCCAADQVTSSGVCCPAGQKPDPKNRNTCVPTTQCAPREAMVNGACCLQSKVYSDASGAKQCCPQDVNQATGQCAAVNIQVPPQCAAGYTQMSDRSCCLNVLVSPDRKTCRTSQPSLPTLQPLVPGPRKETDCSALGPNLIRDRRRSNACTVCPRGMVANEDATVCVKPGRTPPRVVKPDEQLSPPIIRRPGPRILEPDDLPPPTIRRAPPPFAPPPSPRPPQFQFVPPPQRQAPAPPQQRVVPPPQQLRLPPARRCTEVQGREVCQ